MKTEEWAAGDTVKYPILAETLFRIGEKGSREFYRGLAAKRIVNESKKRGGLITLEDLHDYEVVWRKPVEAEINEYRVISMGAPSSGGIAMIQLLKGASFFDMKQYAHNSTSAIHLMTELERRVFADRATFMGDPDFYDVPVEMLLSDAYLKERFADIHVNKPTKSTDIKGGNVEVIESHETTHYSIVDQWGNAVSITTTLNGNFGSKVLVSGGGFFLNNEMDDFSVKPGVPNQFGLIGGEANAIEPEKRMLSSMSPTIVEKNGELWMVVGTPGGSTIITTTYQTIQNAMWYGMSMQESVNATKSHSQWLPDEIHLEEGKVDTTVIDSLAQMGHKIKYRKVLGKMNCIMILENGDLEGAPDYSRGENSAAGF
jgi:gamma-glutamyltranspeptidase/glutathione hydrolase